MGELFDEFDDMDDVFNLTSKDITDKESPKKKKRSENVIHLDLSSVEINDEFRRCLDIMEYSDKHVFVTGDAGTGKSTLLKYFTGTTKKKTVILAPTGVAAVNVGGQTIHSFFKFPPKPLTRSNIPSIKENYLMLYKAVDVIVIDEISMVRVDLMDAIDIFLRENLGIDEPFAGKQIIMFGDLNQLPPILGREGEREMILHKYKSQYFFDADVWKQTGFEGIKLEKVYRQKDKEFIDLLNNIKDGTINDDGIKKINERKGEDRIEDGVITLCSTNAVADHINEMMLSRVHGQEYFLKGTITGDFNIKYCNVEEEIRVKIGCRIMILTNHPEKIWHNGTIATLRGVNMNAGKITIEVDGKMYEVERHEYEYARYSYNRDNEEVESEVRGTFNQFPIRVAYAVTIHKAQGKTFDRINIDIGSGAFAAGQLYVALSRCTSLEGISLSRIIGINDIICDRRISEFYKLLGTGFIGGKKIERASHTEDKKPSDELPF